MTHYAVIAERYGELDDASTEIFGRPDRAVERFDQLDQEAVNAGIPVVHRLFVLREVDDSAMWDWGLRDVDGHVMAYVNERAARACLRPGGALVRCRLGSDVWLDVTL